MIPILCPTCRQLLADKQLYYEHHLDEICNKLETGKISDKESEQAKLDLIASLKLRRYCCREIVVTYVKLIDIIK